MPHANSACSCLSSLPTPKANSSRPAEPSFGLLNSVMGTNAAKTFLPRSVLCQNITDGHLPIVFSQFHCENSRNPTWEMEATLEHRDLHQTCLYTSTWSNCSPVLAMWVAHLSVPPCADVHCGWVREPRSAGLFHSDHHVNSFEKVDSSVNSTS